MQPATPSRVESPRVFQNDVLEYFSHIHPLTPVVVWTPVILYFVVKSLGESGPVSSVLFFAIGVFFWTLLEYVLHRFVFHYKASSALGKRLHFLMHGVHHDYPNDGTRLVMPLLVSVPLALFFYALFSWVFGPWRDGAYAGLVAGYLSYDCLHYAFHHFTLRSGLARALKLYHLKHHFLSPESAYGVSTPLWDVIFRTRPPTRS